MSPACTGKVGIDKENCVGVEDSGLGVGDGQSSFVCPRVSQTVTGRCSREEKHSPAPSSLLTPLGKVSAEDEKCGVLRVPFPEVTAAELLIS